MNDKETDVFIRTGESIIERHVFDLVRDEIRAAGDSRPEVIAFNAVLHDTTLIQYVWVFRQIADSALLTTSQDELVTDACDAADGYMRKGNREIGSIEHDKEIALVEQAETEAKIKELGLWDEYEKDKEGIRKRVAAKRMQVLEKAERKLDAGDCMQRSDNGGVCNRLGNSIASFNFSNPSRNRQFRQAPRNSLSPLAHSVHLLSVQRSKAAAITSPDMKRLTAPINTVLRPTILLVAFQFCLKHCLRPACYQRCSVANF